MIETEYLDFTQEELTKFRESFTRYDLDHNGQLEVFELHQMYESMGETKTNMQLLALIKEADQTAKGGIDYREYLSILLKDKKGLLKGEWGSFSKIAFKEHDTSKDTGRKANIFEQKAKQQAEDQQKAEKIRKQAELRKKVQQEEKESAKKEAERKAKVAENLAKFKTSLSKGSNQ